MSAALELELQLALEGFELDLALASEAQALGVFGPSGAGKTSVLEVLAGWRKVRAGRVVLGGRVLLDTRAGIDVPAHERRIGYVPQDLLLFEHWDVRRNLTAGVGAAGGESILEAVAGVLELGGLLQRPVGRLSGGERQRVALGRALCAGPDLLLLDEPLSSLDVGLRRRVLPFLLRVRAELGTRMVMVSHDATDLAAVCDEVAVLEAGCLVLQAAPADLFAGPEVLLADGVEPDNVLRGRVLEVGQGTADVAIGGAARLVVARGELRPGDEAVVAVRSDDVLVSLERPRGISARNVLAARVEDLVPRGDEVLVRSRLDGGGPVLIAALTPGAVAELELRAGAGVTLLVKTRACRVLARIPAGA